MSRRVKLPGADELFRTTKDSEQPAETEPETELETDGDADDRRRSSGRVRHDEKMTVYITADELFDLESARLALRRDHGVAVDRGRLVREAVAIALADLEDRGADSDIADRLAAS